MKLRNATTAAATQFEVAQDQRAQDTRKNFLTVKLPSYVSQAIKPRR